MKFMIKIQFLWDVTFRLWLIVVGYDPFPTGLLFFLESLILNTTALHSFHKCSNNPQTEHGIWQTRILHTRLWLPQTSLDIHTIWNLIICDSCRFWSSYGSRSCLLVSLHENSDTVCLGSVLIRRKQIPCMMSLPFTEFVQRWRESEVIFCTDKWDRCKLRRRNISAVWYSIRGVAIKKPDSCSNPLLKKKSDNRNVIPFNIVPSPIPRPLRANFPLLEAVLQVILC